MAKLKMVIDDRQVRNAIVTGGAGFIGSHLLDALVTHFEKIYVIDNLVRTNNLRNIKHLMGNGAINKLLGNGIIEFINAEVSTFDFVSYFKPEHNITHCFHLASTRINRISQPEYNKEGHIFVADGGFNVVDYCAKNNIKLWFASTASVYNRPKRFPIEEDDPCTPRTIYGAGKYYTENLIRSYDQMYNFDYAITRFFSVYGERMDNEGVYTEVIFNWFNNIAQGINDVIIYGDPKEKIIDMVHVEDVVQAILLTTFIANKGTFNVSTQTGISLHELVKVFEKITKTKLNVITKPDPRTDVENKRVGSIVRLKEIGWEQTVSLEEGLRRTWKWIQNS